MLISHAGDQHPKYNICFSWCFSTGKSTKRKMKVNKDKAFEWKVCKSLFVPLRFIPFSYLQNADNSHWEQQNGRHFERFKMKRGRNWAYERGKTDRWKLGQMMQRTAPIERRKAARSSHSKSQSHISHQDHLEAHETRKKKTMTNAYSLSTFETLGYIKPPVPPLVFSMTQNAAKRCNNEKHVRLSPFCPLQVFRLVNVSLRNAHVCRVGICDGWDWC